MEILCHDVDQGLHRILNAINDEDNSTEVSSRNGPVVRFKSPTTIVWASPRNRVSRVSARDANPIFHLVEALWMLAGRNDVETPSYFAGHLASFSDDGKVLNGAYGHRWRNHFNIDQLHGYVIPALKKNNLDRRAVLAMWDGEHDVKSALDGSKDVCCNLTAVFDASSGVLDMTVFNRSNDAVLGATGANIVHFSILQEYVACHIGMPVGTYYQISSNTHAYLNDKATQRSMEWAKNTVEPPIHAANCPLLFSECGPSTFMEDLETLMDNYKETHGLEYTFKSVFFSEVVAPVVQAFNLYKNDLLEESVLSLDKAIKKTDWVFATKSWIQRRIDNRNELASNPENVNKVWPSASRSSINTDEYHLADGSLVANKTAIKLRGSLGWTNFKKA
jgi:thymidylate synthase